MLNNKEFSGGGAIPGASHPAPLSEQACTPLNRISIFQSKEEMRIRQHSILILIFSAIVHTEQKRFFLNEF